MATALSRGASHPSSEAPWQVDTVMFLAVLLPVLALAVLLANWLMLREARRRLPNGTKLERAHFVAQAWSTAGLSLMTQERDPK